MNEHTRSGRDLHNDDGTRPRNPAEKVGLLRRDLKQKGDLEKYEARLARIDQKFSALAERISETDPDFAKALRTAWQMPARSLAFRNADHVKKP